MRRLAAAVGLLALLGCPNWDAERDQRCLQLDASTGVCAGLDAGEPDAGEFDAGTPDAGPDTDAGGVIADGGTDAGGPDAGALDVDGGSVPSLLSAATPNSPIYSYGTGVNRVRRPVFLWQLPNSGAVVTVETWDGGFSVWRAGDAAAAGSVDHTWCAAAVNANSPLLGNAKTSGTVVVSVDDLRNSLVVNADYPLAGSTCPAALSQYQRADAGFGFLAMRPLGGGVRFERIACSTCAATTFDFALDNPRVDGAATDGTQRTWVAAGVGPGRQSVVLLEVRADVSDAGTHVLGSGGEDGIQVSASGSSVHAAWLEGQTLWLAALSPTGGLERRSRWLLPAPAQLIDLVENGNTVVAVLASGGRNVMLVHTATGSSFYEIQTGFNFRVTAASLNTVLRLTGQCLFADGDAGGDSTVGCMSASNNPVVDFDQNPGGGLW